MPRNNRKQIQRHERRSQWTRAAENRQAQFKLDIEKWNAVKRVRRLVSEDNPGEAS